MVDVAVNRLSNYMDYIPLMISERLIDVNEDMVGQNIYVTGQFRSFNRHEEKEKPACTFRFCERTGIFRRD